MYKHFSPNTFKIFSGSTLKLIAVLTMLTDHFAAVFRNDLPFLTHHLFGTEYTAYYIMRKIGRLAFPIFCFLIVEGFLHTKDRKKYGINLFVFAIISEIPYNYCFIGKALDFNHQNVYFTLFLGFAALCVLEYVKEDITKFSLTAIMALIARCLNTDYGLYGVLFIAMLYVLREQKAIKTILAYPFLSGGLAAWCAFVPINMYNGQRGFIKGKIMKYAFYSFYPLHILILALVDRFII